MAAWRPVCEALSADGYTVAGPRLPGHGTSWQDLATTHWWDWYGAVENDLDWLRERCETVFVLGLSMGGALALRLAERRPDDVAGLVLVNPALKLSDWRLRFVPVLRHVLRSTPAVGGDIAKPGVGEGAYPRTPLKAIQEMLVMLRDVTANLDRVRSPLLLIVSDVDHVVDPASRELLRAHFDAAQMREVALHRSFHVATIDFDADIVLEQVRAFIHEHTPALSGDS